MTVFGPTTDLRSSDPFESIAYDPATTTLWLSMGSTLALYDLSDPNNPAPGPKLLPKGFSPFVSGVVLDTLGRTAYYISQEANRSGGTLQVFRTVAVWGFHRDTRLLCQNISMCNSCFLDMTEKICLQFCFRSVCSCSPESIWPVLQVLKVNLDTRVWSFIDLGSANTTGSDYMSVALDGGGQTLYVAASSYSRKNVSENNSFAAR